MADQIAVVHFTTPAAVDAAFPVVSSEITETPRALIVLWGNSTNDGTNETPARMGMAIVALDATTNTNKAGAHSVVIRNGQATPTGASGDGNEGIVIHLDDASGILIVASLAAVVSGGVNLNFSTVSGGAQVKATAIILAGNSMRSWGGVCSSGSVTPAQRDQGQSPNFFQPDVLLTLTSPNSLDSPTRSTQGLFGFGGVTALGQKSQNVNWRNGVEPSEVDGTVRSALGNVGFIGLSRVLSGHTFVLNSTGYTFAGTNTNDIRARTLAIKFGGNFKVGVVNEPIAASTGLQSFTALGFTPRVVIGFVSNMAAEDTQIEDETAAACGIFLAGPGVQRAATVREEEGHTGVSVVSGRKEDVALLCYDHLGAVDKRATWAGGVPGGFAFDFSSASTTGYMTLVGIELAPAPPLPPRRVRRSRAIRTPIARHPHVVGGRPPGNPPLSPRFWTAVARLRRAAQARLRRIVLPFTAPRTIFGVPTDEGSKGRIFTPGLRRGKITWTGNLPERDP